MITYEKWNTPDTLDGQKNNRVVLKLGYKQKFFGRPTFLKTDIVFAKWDSLNECYYEESTGIEIYHYDIVGWMLAKDVHFSYNN